MTVNQIEEKKRKIKYHNLLEKWGQYLRFEWILNSTFEGHTIFFQMSSMDETVLYRLKNLNNHNVISVFKDQFKIGRASSK